MRNEQISKLIRKDLFGDNNESESDDELHNHFEYLRISSNDSDSRFQEENTFLQNPFTSLMNRKKFEHLTFAQKNWIYWWHESEGKSINQLSQLTETSTSTIRRIIEEFRSNIKRSEIYTNIRWRKSIKSRAVSKWISKFASDQTGCFTSADVQRHVKNQLLIWVPLHQIRKHLKEKDRLSYKKGNPRPINLDVSRVKLLKQLFWIRIAKKVSNIRMLINIDESSITKDTRRNYSWLRTGKSWPINNTKMKNSINVITAITTNGLAINMFKYQSTTAEVFKFFLDYTLNYLRSEGIEPKDIGIILDNCSSHRANTIRKYWEKIEVRLYYLPQYSPELAPVENYFA